MIRNFCLSLAVMSTVFISIASAQQAGKVTSSGIGYLEYLPQGYHSDSDKYPVVIFLHGIQEKGTSSADPKKVLADLHKVDNVGLPKYVKYGTKYPFILISPQLKSNQGLWTPSYVMQVLNHVKKFLRIDDRRIYLTGLSLGGFGVWRTAGEYPETFAAIAPICSGGNALNKAQEIAAKSLPVWGFHGDKDNIVSHTVTTKMINAINSSPKKPNPMAKVTIFPGMGHVIWDKAYQQTNLLDWMLSHRKGSASPDQNDDKPSTENILPTVYSGPDRVISLPSNSLTINGKATDKDGRIVAYQWTQTYGSPANLSGANASTVRISNLRQGIYIFKLRAKDNKGGVNDDYFKITVNDPKANKGNNANSIPHAYAGPDRVLKLPHNALTIQGQASDKDGKVVSYQWRQTYGRPASLSGDRSSRVRIHNLQSGIYIFGLTVKDNRGATKHDYFKITVKD